MNHLLLVAPLPVGTIPLTVWICLMLMVLLAIVAHVELRSRKSQRIHDQKLNVLKEMIAHLLEIQEAQSAQIRLSEELKEKLQHANHTLSSEIVALIKELIETLTQNNLLKK